ncbi:hypothetical protein H257_02643 [Aphanomyces astaci]|uniref:Ribosome-binding factor A n=2 Tax=Aphanomyces astaci TaxID=112090 RepID=W4H4L5_APHAT|nr:hypothetical protein H257_02643 [Aphanomyces astaci]ETV86204.1 hypothetical protein H257_02643 [Aphanomyces astaci]|eukprot:XP_009824676.1 hypothetical protein H257_02643 [Aphanomyces astaci]
MLSRAAGTVLVRVASTTRTFHSTPMLSARKSKSLSRLTIKRSVLDTQNTMKNFDMSSFQDDEDDNKDAPPSVQITNMKAALKQLNDPDSFDLDKIPLMKRGATANEDMMTEEEFEAFLDEDEDDEDEEHDRELEALEREDDKKRVTKMLSPARAMQALQGGDKKRVTTKNAKPLQRDEKADNRFNPELVNHRQQRVGLLLEGFIQDVILRETDLCKGSTQVWITSVNMSPDLRRADLYWDVTTVSHGKVSKTVEAKVVRRLTNMTKWLRVRVTQELGLKYTPKLEFKRQDNTGLERQKLFDALMAQQGY